MKLVVSALPGAFATLLSLTAVSFGMVAALTTLSSSAVAQSSSISTSSSQANPNGAYIAIDPLAGVKYNNRFDVSLSMAYAEVKAGPPPLHSSAPLGGLDLSGSYWFSKHWALEGSGRGYLGTSGAYVNDLSIDGPFVSQYLFVAGPEWLGPHNKHGAFLAHALVGGAYGNFDQDLRGNSPSVVSFYNNQLAPAAVFGGHIDLNRSAHWVFRVTPDAIWTHYSINYGSKASFSNWNPAVSAGIEYKFKKKR